VYTERYVNDYVCDNCGEQYKSAVLAMVDDKISCPKCFSHIENFLKRTTVDGVKARSNYIAGKNGTLTEHVLPACCNCGNGISVENLGKVGELPVCWECYAPIVEFNKRDCRTSTQLKLDANTPLTTIDPEFLNNPVREVDPATYDVSGKLLVPLNSGMAVVIPAEVHAS